MNSIAFLIVSSLLWLALARNCSGFAPPNAPAFRLATATTRLKAVEERSFVEGIVDTLKNSLRIVQESNANGYDFKQTLANVLAGDYDEASIQAQIEAEIQSASCVLFTWERSPSCVKALKALELMGLSNSDKVKIVRLDDPWDEGNPIRAQIGKMVGRTSVPAIFIGGDYVGGFDGGTENAPGIQSMAFQCALRPKLEAAGISLPK